MAKTSAPPILASRTRRARRARSRRRGEDDNLRTPVSPPDMLQHTVGNQLLSQLAHHPDAGPGLVRGSLQRLLDGPAQQPYGRAASPVSLTGGPRIQRIVDTEIRKLERVRGKPYKFEIEGALGYLQSYEDHMHAGQIPKDLQVQQVEGASQILAAITPLAKTAGRGDKRHAEQGARQAAVAAEVRPRLLLELAAIKKFRNAGEGMMTGSDAGGVNDVTLLLFGDNWEAFLKTNKPPQEGQHNDQRYLAGRNVALYRLDKLLGTGVIPRTKQAHVTFAHLENKEETGTLMEKVRGKQMEGKEKQTDGSKLPTIPKVDMATPEVQRGFSNLQLLDSIAGQVDRHRQNVFIEVGPKGNIVGVKGIDNDYAFGMTTPAMGESGTREWYQGMPKFIDLSTAQHIAGVTEKQVYECLVGLIHDEEIENTVQRFRVAQAYCRSLLEYARTGQAEARYLVSQWNATTFQNQMNEGRQEITARGGDPNAAPSRTNLEYLKSRSYLYARTKELETARALGVKEVQLADWREGEPIASAPGRIVRPFLRRPAAAAK